MSAKIIRLIAILVVLLPLMTQVSVTTGDDDTREYYIDSVSGDDQNSGTSEDAPWQTLEKVSSMTYQPGDHIYFKR